MSTPPTSPLTKPPHGPPKPQAARRSKIRSWTFPPVVLPGTVSGDSRVTAKLLCSSEGDRPGAARAAQQVDLPPNFEAR